MDILYIDTAEELCEICSQLSKEKILGIDLECENNLHHYGTYISIIQISSKSKNYIVDVLKLKKIDCLIEILENPDIEKIFHDVNFDFRVLNYEFNCRPKNVFDTQAAIQFLGRSDIGLEPVLREYFGKEKNTKFQMADWTKRPISNRMLEYAINDTIYLIELRNKLAKELREAKRWKWFMEEKQALDSSDLKLKDMCFGDLKGLKDLTDTERAIAKRLYMLRDKLAKKVNRAQHFIFNNKRLIALAQNPPKKLDEWEKMQRVHPIVRTKARLFFNETKKGQDESVPFKFDEIKRYTPKQRERARELNEARNEVYEKYKIAKNLLITKNQIRKIVLEGKSDFLKNWQIEVFKKYL